MTELTFVKSFLSAVDSRPVRFSQDYVADPSSMKWPIPYTLPRLPQSYASLPKKIKTTDVPGAAKSVNVQLKSARNPTLDLSLDNAPLTTTTVHDLREFVRQRVVVGDSGQPPAAEKIKILFNKKPVGGSAEKTLAEILSDVQPDALSGGKTVEFGVMIMGGAIVRAETAPAETQKESAPGTTEPSGEEVLSTDAFWSDLQEFLGRRIRDRDEASRLATIFRQAWEASRS